MNNDSNKKRSSNDAARIHLMETLKTVNINGKNEATLIIQQQFSRSGASPTANFRRNKFINYLSCEGWALRVRKSGKKISQEIKNFIQ
jgi:hypothetical protein